MKKRISPLPALLLLLLLVGSAALAVPSQRPTGDERLKALADGEWSRARSADAGLSLEAGLPVRFPSVSEEASLETAKQGERLLGDLARIDVSHLTEDARITYDILVQIGRQKAGRAQFYWIDFNLAPYEAGTTFVAMHRALASLPLTTDAHTHAYIDTLRGYRTFLQQNLVKLKGQEARGIRMSAPAIADTRAMLLALQSNIDKNFAPAATRLTGLSPEARLRFEQAVKEQISLARGDFEALLKFLDGPYRRKAPANPSLNQYPGGRAFYRHLVRTFTTLDLRPEALHSLGLRRVAELEKQIRAQAARVGISGTLPEIYERFSRDPRFVPKSSNETARYFLSQLKVIEPKLSQYFAAIPQIPYGVERLPPELEQSSTFGYYSRPTEQNPRGIYYFNGSDVEKRSLLSGRAIIFHELVPGHHFYNSVHRAAAGLHPLRRSYRLVGLSEGWAEYASSLGYEMGLYEDTHQDIGRRSLEMFVAARLVVDTGLGYYGWSLEKARDYMRRHVHLSELEIGTETMRYATRPAQAVAYRVGYEKIWELRRRAEARLGSSFDIKAFHAIVLGGGVMPLATLEWRVNRWIEQTVRAGTRPGR